MSGLERMKILIVDDNYHMLNIIATVLRGFAAKDFIETIDPIEALAALRTHRIDLVIVDYNMPVLDGIDFVRLVRSSPDILNQCVPIIMLTAHTERRRVMSARDAGITEFCAKPVTAAELARKINAAVCSPRPFVKSATYAGPCRRRRGAPFKGRDRRRGGPLEPDPVTRNEASEAAQWTSLSTSTPAASAAPSSEDAEAAAWEAMA